MNFTSNWIVHTTYVRTDSPYYVRPSVPKRLDVKNSKFLDKQKVQCELTEADLFCVVSLHFLFVH